MTNLFLDICLAGLRILVRLSPPSLDDAVEGLVPAQMRRMDTLTVGAVEWAGPIEGPAVRGHWVYRSFFAFFRSAQYFFIR